VTLNGKPVPMEPPTVGPNDTDQHLSISANLLAATNTLKIRLRNDFAVSVANRLPALGNTSQGLHILSQSWNTALDTLTLATEGLPGQTYTLSLWGKEQIKSVDGARLVLGDKLEEKFGNASSGEPVKQTVVLHFLSTAKR